MGGRGGGQAQREEGGGHGGRPRWCSAAACELGKLGVRTGGACVWIIWSGLWEMNGVVHDLSWALKIYGPSGLSRGGLFRLSLRLCSLGLSS